MPIKILIGFIVLGLFMNPAYSISIAVLRDCNEALEHPSVYTVLNDSRNTLDGWSHVEKDKPNGEYRSLKLSDDAYKISKDKFKPEDSCSDRHVQHSILVVKLSDWTRQHSNGIETILDSNSVRFGDVTHVMMDVRVNAKGTHILSSEDLFQRYKDYLPQEKFEEFDKGKVNLGITLFEDGALDQSSESFNLEYFLEIDQALYADQWVRVLIPLTDFTAYTEKNYKASSKALGTYTNVPIKGFRINPENSHGKQLRNLIGDNWHKDIPETFKEASISLRRIEFLSM